MSAERGGSPPATGAQLEERDERSADWAEAAVAEAAEEDHELAQYAVGGPTLSLEEQVLQRIDRARRRKSRIKEERITLAHGAGGKATHTLIDALFLEAFRNPVLEAMEDQASFTIDGTRLAFTTDSFVVHPLFFPGGNIGDLAVNGTVNDLAVGGARPLYLSAAFVLEEGFPIADLQKIASSMALAAAAGGHDPERGGPGGQRCSGGRRARGPHPRGGAWRERDSRHRPALRGLRGPARRHRGRG